MIKKLTKHGNSWALIIDKAILELLKIDPDTPLELSTDGTKLTISPLNDSERRRKFEDAHEWANEKYSGAFKRLAE